MDVLYVNQWLTGCYGWWCTIPETLYEQDSYWENDAFQTRIFQGSIFRFHVSHEKKHPYVMVYEIPT